ncbi:hypothetical protein [Methylobacterium thuringiense]|uniref:Uncharacterized protein n=1 Tax=Methylobacterium thuringiense TaxID=1003091 RepID=A0ABQ4TII2_9HYPH|nr:hypothetical protein [Methylobacterium thuringiense]GJE54597.1 hypothetical protein EKPJFOCH_1075 [Methylobacterium thuringiense]
MTKAVGFDEMTGSLVIMDNGVFPAGSLIAYPSPWPERIQVDSIAGRGEQIIEWHDVRRLDPADPWMPASLDEALAYLRGEFAKRPAVEDGFVLTEAASTAMGGHRVVARRDGALVYATYDDPAAVEAVIGVTRGAVDVGGTPDIQRVGPLQEPSWSWADGPVYLGANGQLTQQAPEHGAVLQMGVAVSPTTVFLDIQEPYHLTS